MFQEWQWGHSSPLGPLPDLVPSSCALAPRRTREAGFLKYISHITNRIHAGPSIWAPSIWLVQLIIVALQTVQSAARTTGFTTKSRQNSVRMRARVMFWLKIVVNWIYNNLETKCSKLLLLLILAQDCCKPIWIYNNIEPSLQGKFAIYILNFNQSPCF